MHIVLGVLCHPDIPDEKYVPAIWRYKETLFFIFCIVKNAFRYVLGSAILLGTSPGRDACQNQ